MAAKWVHPSVGKIFVKSYNQPIALLREFKNLIIARIVQAHIFNVAYNQLPAKLLEP